MIKGSQPLAKYNPEKFHITNPFQVSEKNSINQTCSFTLKRPVDLGSQESNENKPKSDKMPILVVELMVKDRTSDIFAKNFETDLNGFSNIGHNMLKLKLFGQEIHQSIQVLFDEVIFCSVGLAIHIQTIKFHFDDFIKKLSKKLFSKI
jgi:hypothetical protein